MCCFKGPLCRSLVYLLAEIKCKCKQLEVCYWKYLTSTVRSNTRLEGESYRKGHSIG